MVELHSKKKKFTKVFTSLGDLKSLLPPKNKISFEEKFTSRGIVRIYPTAERPNKRGGLNV
jgi:hypothetical protein